MRRKKKLIKNLIKILVVAIIAVGLYFFFKPKKKINTTDSDSNNRELIKVTTINKPNIEITLPENIKDSKENTTSENKTYTPLVEVSERYLVPILANNTVTILIGDDSEKLLTATSPVQIGNEYTVSGIAETIQSVYYFTIDDYSYPIFLLLGESGKLYYVDIEKAYTTGKFEINGYIQNIPEVENVYQTTVEKGSKNYRSAVIKCTDGVGYEFNIDMIGR